MTTYKWRKTVVVGKSEAAKGNPPHRLATLTRPPPRTIKDIICPHCKKAFKVDEAGYAGILKHLFPW